MNPFRSGIVASPWESTVVDVNTIHHEVFEQCLQGIQQVRATQRSAGLLIHGEAGSGKTHLLRRLRSHLAPQAPSATDRDECLYVWVRLQTSPRMIWRTLRRTLVDDWFRPVSGMNSQFQRILFHRFAEIRTAEGDLERWYDYMLENDRPGLKDLLDRIADALDLDRNTAVAFEHIAFGRHVRDLRAWLSGDSLPEAALVRMDLAQDEGTDEEREDQSRQIVLMLCRLAGNGLPIVISFDQVEALQMSPGDRDALFSFGQVTSTLHDSTTNVLIVSCVQSVFVAELRDHARRADYDRMTSLGAWSLDPLNRDQALQLIQARLSQFSDAEMSKIPTTAGWPLAPAAFDELFAKDGSIPPRQLLSLCAERFEAWLKQSRKNATSGNAVPSDPTPETSPTTNAVEESPARPAVATFFKEKWAAAIEEKHASSTPERTEEIIRHGLPMLVRLVAAETKLVTDDLLPDVSLVFETESGRTGISLCTQANMNSLSARLKRLKTQFSTERLQRLVVIRDSRIPISATAKKSQQLLDELEQQQAVVLHPTMEVLAALDALRDLLSDAKSGNLSWHGGTILPQTLEEWLVGNLTDGLRDLVDQVLGNNSKAAGKGASDTRDVEALNTLLATRPVLQLDEAAEALNRPIETVTSLAERYPDQFRVLNGPPATLFRAEEAASQHS
ncbi:MAG: ATP-binding protein [Planctomycetota bacterium]